MGIDHPKRIDYLITIESFHILNNFKLRKHAIYAVLISVEVGEIQLNFIKFCRGISILK